MTLCCGIVGLPNVGKSTLFNALVQNEAAEAANYPFCTIDPNVGIIEVPDERLAKLSHMAQSQKTIYNRLEFVDIAGLVEGASSGEGLGNKFLSHIRNVDAIAYVLRCFDDDNITHVANRIDPCADAQIIMTELALADIDSLKTRIPKLEKKAKQSEEGAEILKLCQEALHCLENDRSVLSIQTAENKKQLEELQLLTTKPYFFICNVSEEDAATENSYVAQVRDWAAANIQVLVVSAKIESEINSIDDPEEVQEFLKAMGLKESGLKRLARAAYTILNLETFFTIGPKEARAWTMRRGCLAPQAAGVIHSDFERGFIRAEVVGYDDYLDCNGEAAARSSGKMRTEGKGYTMQDGDIVHFLFNI